MEFVCGDGHFRCLLLIYIHHHIFYHGGAPLENLLSRSLIKTTAAAAGSACLYQQVKDIAPSLNDISNHTLCAATSIE